VCSFGISGVLVDQTGCGNHKSKDFNALTDTSG